MTADLAEVAARFAAVLRTEGVAVGVERAARFARAVVLVAPESTAQLYRCALATLVASPAEIEILDRVFAAVFGDAPFTTTSIESHGARFAMHDTASRGRPGPERTAEVATRASAAERLASRDFGGLTADELARLAELMREFRISTPPRRSRRHRSARVGVGVDLRETLRQARRTGAEPVSLRRRVRRSKPRKLVVLCDISGSMAAYARALLQLLYCAAGGAHAEVFTFATRLTRITRVLAAHPERALREAGGAAPDWSGGTRIGAAIREFVDSYGASGMARGAVVVIISDGWDTGDAAVLGTAMARLSRLAHRIVWANPRTASPRYRPLVGGMAAAWPYCDAVVSAHRLDAVDELIAAIAHSANPADRTGSPVTRTR